MSDRNEMARMDEAFKRAADKALYGTREERAGRFVLDSDMPARRVDIPSQTRKTEPTPAKT